MHAPRFFTEKPKMKSIFLKRGDIAEFGLRSLLNVASAPGTSTCEVHRPDRRSWVRSAPLAHQQSGSMFLMARGISGEGQHIISSCRCASPSSFHMKKAPTAPAMPSVSVLAISPPMSSTMGWSGEGAYEGGGEGEGGGFGGLGGGGGGGGGSRGSLGKKGGSTAPGGSLGRGGDGGGGGGGFGPGAGGSGDGGGGGGGARSGGG